MPVKARTREEAARRAFADRTKWDGDCLVWTGALVRGYGTFFAEGALVYAHRYAYENARGPIPTEMHIDHECHNAACVNPEHLRVATPTQNTRNRRGADRGRKHNLPRGVTPNGKGYRARVYCDNICHGQTFSTVEEAAAWASSKRHELYGEYAGKD